MSATPEFPGQAASPEPTDYSQPHSGLAPAAAPGKATSALIFGIIGIFFCPIVLSVLAIRWGGQAREVLERQPELGGLGKAKAAVVLGWIGIGLAALYILGVIVFGVFGA